MQLTECRVDGGKPSFFFRKGTSDEHILAANISENPEYIFPKELKPKVIFDIGANIGVVSVIMANVYPDAKIYAYEPNPVNFEILIKNTKGYGEQIEIHNAALAAEAGKMDLYLSDDPNNHGGCSLYQHRVDMSAKPFEVTCFSARKEFEMAGGKVDLVKIDCEGSEWQILSSLTPAQLQSIQIMVGELHGINDFQTLALLDPYFHIAVAKNLRDTNFPFTAQRRK